MVGDGGSVNVCGGGKKNDFVPAFWFFRSLLGGMDYSHARWAAAIGPLRGLR